MDRKVRTSKVRRAKTLIIVTIVTLITVRSLEQKVKRIRSAISHSTGCCCGKLVRLFCILEGGQPVEYPFHQSEWGGRVANKGTSQGKNCASVSSTALHADRQYPLLPHTFTKSIINTGSYYSIIYINAMSRPTLEAHRKTPKRPECYTCWIHRVIYLRWTTNSSFPICELNAVDRKLEWLLSYHVMDPVVTIQLVSV